MSSDLPGPMNTVPMPTPDTMPAGGSWSCQLSPWPLWSQLSDWTVGGVADINRTENCLPESLAMTIMYLRGIELPASYIKDVEYSPQFQGYTDFAHATSFLSNHCGIDSTDRQASTQQQMAYWIWDYLVKGRPILILRSFSTPTSDDRHIMACTRIDPQYIYFADPWTGTMIREDYQTAFAWFKGWLLGIEAIRPKHL